jgi:hypothetical protein
LPRYRAISAILLVCGAALAAGLGGCSGSLQVFEDKNEGGWFSKPFSSLHKPDWTLATSRNQTVSLGPSGPVALEQLVGADGRCAEAVAEAAPPPPPPPPSAPAAAAEPAPAAAPPAPPADRPVGSIAGDLAGPPMPAAPPPPPAPARPVTVAAANPEALHGLQGGGPTLTGGVALGMTECDAVRRAGQPSDVNIGADAKGERKVVLTYLSGTRPGIYTFTAGRLQQVTRAPGQPAAEKPARKRAKKKPAPNKTAAQPKGEQVYVQ